jgi:ankyrin repeat protein
MAVESGQKEAVIYLLEKGANIEARAGDGMTPLLISAQTGNLALFDLLVQNGADPAAVDSGKNSALMVMLKAFSQNRENAGELAHALIRRGADIHARNNWGDTALHFAARYNQTGVLEQLIQNKADITTANRYGETPIFVSLGSPFLDGWPEPPRSGTFERLVGEKQDFAIRDTKGNTLLHRTCRPDYIRTLIAKGVPVGVKNGKEMIPPFFALAHCRAAAVLEYIAHGFDPKETGPKGKTTLQTAMNNPYFSADLPALLLKHGADATQTDPDGRSAIHAAAAHSPEMIDLIVAHGGDINARTKTNATPLHVAASIRVARIAGGLQPPKGHDDNTRAYARLLNQKGIEIDIRDIKGCTPLHRAVNSGSLEKIALLIEKGADINAKEERGHTPMDMAVLKHDARMTGLFEKHGAKTTVDPAKRYSVLCAYP